MERPTCLTCPYWNRDEDSAEDEGYGQCQRFPPAPDSRVFELVDGDWKLKEKTDHLLGKEVMQWDWCGEHPSFLAYIASLGPVFPEELKAEAAD